MEGMDGCYRDWLEDAIQPTLNKIKSTVDLVRLLQLER